MLSKGSRIGGNRRLRLSEAIFCGDHDNSVLEMGDQLVREGPALRAQKEAAAIFWHRIRFDAT
jgi:hypothetical protein